MAIALLLDGDASWIVNSFKVFVFLIVARSSDEIGDDDNHNQCGQDATDDDRHRVIDWLYRRVAAVRLVEAGVTTLPTGALFTFLQLFIQIGG